MLPAASRPISRPTSVLPVKATCRGGHSARRSGEETGRRGGEGGQRAIDLPQPTSMLPVRVPGRGPQGMIPSLAPLRLPCQRFCGQGGAHGLPTMRLKPPPLHSPVNAFVASQMTQ